MVEPKSSPFREPCRRARAALHSSEISTSHHDLASHRVWRQANAFDKTQDDGSRGPIFGKVKVPEYRSVAEEYPTRTPAFCRMEDVAGATAHDRNQQTDVVGQIRPPPQGCRDIRQRSETDDGEGTALKRAFECRMRGFNRSRPFSLQRSRRAAVDKDVRASNDPPNQVARRSVDDGQRRIAEDGRNPNDLDVR